MIFDSIRGRLTSWYTLVLAIVLVAAGILSYLLMSRAMRKSGDDTLENNARDVIAALRDEAAESSGAPIGRQAADVFAGFRDNDEALMLFSESGDELAASATPLSGTIARPPLRARIARHSLGYESTEDVMRARILIRSLKIDGRYYVLVVAHSSATRDALLADLRRAMILTIPLALLVAAAGGYLLARKSLAPVAAMSAQARAMGAADLTERIAVVNGRDELGQLALTLNGLLARLEEAFASQRRFMTDASHELRTPVAILQGELDVTLARPDRDAGSYRESLEVMRRSVKRLTRIVRDLFLLARSDAGQYPLRFERLYLEDLAVETVRGFRTTAADRGVQLLEKHESDLLLTGDIDLIQRLIGNLVENAIKNTSPGGEVSVRSSRDGTQFRIEVSNVGGPTIPLEWRERVFERFFRGEPPSGLPHGDNVGAGLGLPIARWIAGIHGGHLSLERSDGRETLFVATLNLEPPTGVGVLAEAGRT